MLFNMDDEYIKKNKKNILETSKITKSITEKRYHECPNCGACTILPFAPRCPNCFVKILYWLDNNGKL